MSDSSQPDLSVIIVNWNTGDLLRQCLESLRPQAATACFETLVVDNASKDGSGDMVQALFPEVQLIANAENLGFAAANNQAIRRARGRYLLLLNPDTIVMAGALQTMVGYLDQHLDVGALGCRLLNADGSVQTSCSHFPTLSNVALDSLGLSRLFPRSRLLARYKMTYWGHDEEREVDQPSGACLMIRRKAWEQVGPLDERFFMYYEEVDLCRRLRQQGWRIVFTPVAQVVHLGGQSSRQHLDVRIVTFRASQFLFFRKHCPAWQLAVLKGVVLCEMAWRTVAVLLQAALSAQARQAVKPVLQRYARVALLCLQRAGRDVKTSCTLSS